MKLYSFLSGIVALSQALWYNDNIFYKSYQVLCRHTSFVGIEERKEAVEGTMQTRHVISALPFRPPPAGRRMLLRGTLPVVQLEFTSGHPNLVSSPAVISPKPISNQEKMENIIFLQMFNGSWSLDKNLAKVGGEFLCHTKNSPICRL